MMHAACRQVWELATAGADAERRGCHSAHPAGKTLRDCPGVRLLVLLSFVPGSLRVLWVLGIFGVLRVLGSLWVLAYLSSTSYCP